VTAFSARDIPWGWWDSGAEIMASVLEQRRQAPGRDDLARLYRQSQRQWQGCAWPTSFGPAGLNLQGLRSEQAQLMANATAGQEARTWKKAAAWLREVEADARKADDCAALALQHALAGDLDRAGLYAEQAWTLESKYRLPAVWGPFREALLAATEAAA